MLHIIANQFTLTEFLLESLPAEQRARVLMHPRRIKGVAYSLLKGLDAWLPFRLPGFSPFPADYLRGLEAIGPQAPVLVFGVENLKDLRIVRKYLRSRHIAIFTWNPVMDHQQTPWIRRLHIAQLKRLGRVFTFDPGDAARHGLARVAQVYRPVDGLRRQGPPEIDIYFLGKDKGRFELLRRCGTEWQALGLRLDLRVIEETGESHPTDGVVQISRDALTYRENIDRINRARCLLELTQANQTGLTIRCLEALFFDRKLVTNNPRVKAMPFYRADRFFVLGQDDPAGLAAFVASPMVPLPAEALAPHTFALWLRQFETVEPV